MKEWWGDGYNRYAVMVLGAALGIGCYTWIPWNEAAGSTWAAWVQAIGSIGAILAAVWVSYDQHAKARKRDAEKEKKEVENILKSVRDEVRVMSEGFAKNVGKHLEDSKDGEPFEVEWHPADAPFPIYDACASQIGKINDDNLRRDIIRTYAQARGLLATLKMNGLLRDKIHSYVLYWHERDPDHAKKQYDQNMIYLVEFANSLRSSHRIAKQSVADLISDIDRFLAASHPDEAMPPSQSRAHG